MRYHVITKEKQSIWGMSVQAFQRKWHLKWKNEWNFPDREKEYSKQKQCVQVSEIRNSWHSHGRMRTSWNIQHRLCYRVLQTLITLYLCNSFSVAIIVIILDKFTRPVDNHPIAWPLGSLLPVIIQKGEMMENLLSLPQCL